MRNIGSKLLIIICAMRLEDGIESRDMAKLDFTWFDKSYYQRSAGSKFMGAYYIIKITVSVCVSARIHSGKQKLCQ